MAVHDIAPRRRVRQDPEKESKEAAAWGGVLTANATLVVWLVFLAFGGTLLALYYRSIGYFPDLEWKESLTYLMVLSLLGGGVAIIYGLLLFIPGAMWCEFLIHDTELEDKLCYQGRGKEPCFWSILLHMGFPFLCFMLVMHFAAFAGKWATVWCAAALLAMISSFHWQIFGAHLETKSKEKDSEETSNGPTRKSLLLKYIVSFNASALASLASMLVLYQILRGTLESGSLIIYICTGVVTLTNFLVAVQFRGRFGRAVLTAILAALVLLVSGEILENGNAALSKRIMAKFGIGDEAKVSLVVKKEGRKLFHRLKVSTDGPAGSAGVVRDARLLSRLGKEYLVQVKTPVGLQRVTIPRDLVLSMSAP